MDTNSITESSLQWCGQIDILLANWCDQSKCFEYMHNETSSSYASKAKKSMILLTVLSAFSGTTNIIAGSSEVNGFQIAWIFGGLSIVLSLGNILQDKLGYAQLSESHRLYASTWGQILRKIESEIILPYPLRKDCSSFLKMIRTEIDQVSIAGAYKLNKKVREECYDKFKTVVNFDIPDICGQVEHTVIYTPPHIVINVPLTPRETLPKNEAHNTI